VSRRFTTEPVEKGDGRDGADDASRPFPANQAKNRRITAHDVLEADFSRDHPPHLPLVDAATLAAYLNVERSWVYEHADELGARRLGSGPRARLRFSIAEVDQRLTTCTRSRESRSPDPAPLAALRPRRRRRMGTSVALLPIRGRSGELAS
jgi:hypothetical protein